MKNFQTIKKTSLLFLLIVFIVQSCTIEKRAFMPGYHIDWKSHKSIPASKAISEKATEISSKNEIDSLYNDEIKSENVAENLSENQSNQNIYKSKQEQSIANQVVNKDVKTTATHPVKNKIIHLTSKKINQKVIKSNRAIIQKNSYDDEVYGSDLNIFSLISFIAAILSAALAAVPLISIGLAIGGLVLGIIGNNEISRGDYLYGLNKTFAVIGIVISSIMILVNIILVLGILFLFLLFF